MVKGRIFNIQRYSVQDGPGVRTTVFLKGCPLRCLWCSNPESQNPFPEVAHRDSLCTGCNRCVEVCELGAISLTGKRLKIDRKTCDNCARCVAVCSPGALKIYGQEMSVEEVFEEVRKDDLIYRNSGGGVTASGGEPLLQPDFVAALFKRCQRAGLHTALETSGHVKPEIFEQVLAHTDLVLFDLKHLDAAIHRKFTGVPNRLILDNFRTLVKSGIPVRARVPLIPDISASEENIRAAVQFIRSLDSGIPVDILPYHRFGTGKYQMLDRPYELGELARLTPEQVASLKALVESSGLDCAVVD